MTAPAGQGAAAPRTRALSVPQQRMLAQLHRDGVLYGPQLRTARALARAGVATLVYGVPDPAADGAVTHALRLPEWADRSPTHRSDPAARAAAIMAEFAALGELAT